MSYDRPPSAAAAPPASGPWWLQPALLFDGERLRDSMALRIEHARVSAIAPASESGQDGAPCWCSDALACPAFVDLQVNGGGGVLFTQEPTPAALITIAAAHRLGGTGAWLPTLVTSRPEVMEQAVEAVLAVHGEHGVAGIHIEGPHIAPDFRGAHPLELIRPFDDHTLRLLLRLRAQSIPVVLTLAPELLPRGVLRKLVDIGVRVSIGHSGASAEQTRAALGEGATLFTHLFNGMPPLQTKNPGMAGVALDSAAWCGVIADGHHIEDTMLRLAIRAKREPHSMFAVTDAMPTVHGPPEFEGVGAKIHLREGKLIDARGSLAGAHIDMVGTLQRLVHRVGLPLETALAMVTAIPARAAGLRQYGFLLPQSRADIALLDPMRLELQQLLIKGEPLALTPEDLGQGESRPSS
ncbi:MAG TPA: N-acetylglucosamine-6-phosphate deacetylase [Acidiferrobacteraceae bacterium]|nr:N-acetylglucosamine-6-phosphate deacetylase [Acidiferrobacteraceae bacterium]